MHEFWQYLLVTAVIVALWLVLVWAFDRNVQRQAEQRARLHEAFREMRDEARSDIDDEQRS